MKKLFIFLLLCLFTATGSFAQKYEAESAVLAGGATVVASATESGGFYVAQGEGNLSFDVNVETLASYNIYLQVASPYGIKANHIVIDGSTFTFNTSQNASFTRVKVASGVRLTAGTHKIQILKSWGWIHIDYLDIEKVEPAVINTTLVTPEPTDEAKRLYRFLRDHYGKKIISGVMDMADANWLKTNTGKSPALIGLDFMQTGRGYSWYNDQTPFNEALAYYNKNGIPALVWHWRDPSRLTDAFYTKDTSFDITKIFDESSAEYKAMLKDIDYTAGLLKKFQDAKVPVLWRPLHEAAGGWFWWGAKGAAPCKKLWQIMFDRMVHYHGLHNLIWVWTREPNDDAWYPGDEYVDMVGRDIYRTGDHGSQLAEFNDMSARYGGKKMVTISECGSMPDVDNLVKDGAGWSYFMPWYGDFVRNSTYNSLALWKKNMASDYVITLDEMPNLRTYPAPVFEPVGPYCQGSVVAALPTVSTNGFKGTWSPEINNMETTTYTFTPDSGQDASIVKMIVVISEKITPTFFPFGSYCKGSYIPVLPDLSNNGIRGSWSPAINNMETTTYTFTPEVGQCAGPTTMTLTIHENIAPLFEPVGPFNKGSVIPPLPYTSLNGITGSWNPAINNMQTTTYTFTPGTGQCASSVEMTVIIDTDTPVNELAGNSSFKVFPTSFDNQFTVQSDKVIQMITVTNVMGARIKIIRPHGLHSVVTLDGVPPGIYFVKADGYKAVKVIKHD